MTVKDIKKELTLYNELNIYILKLEDKIEILYYDLADVKALRYDKQKGNVNNEELKRIKQELSLKIEILERELTRVSLQVEYLDNILNAIKDDKLREAVKDVYINGKGLREVANRFNCTHTTLMNMIDNELEDIINKLYP
jgi:hypothetical protein